MTERQDCEDRALRAGAIIAPISEMRTLRHTGLGELLKHTLAAEPGSWVPGLPLSPQPGVSTVLTQSSPSCPCAEVVEGQESTGRQRRTLWGGPGQERPPLSRVEWCQSGSSDRAEGGQLVLGWGRAHSQPSLQEGGP